MPVGRAKRICVRGASKRGPLTPPWLAAAIAPTPSRAAADGVVYAARTMPLPPPMYAVCCIDAPGLVGGSMPGIGGGIIPGGIIPGIMPVGIPGIMPGIGPGMPGIPGGIIIRWAIIGLPCGPGRHTATSGPIRLAGRRRRAPS